MISVAQKVALAAIDAMAEQQCRRAGDAPPHDEFDGWDPSDTDAPDAPPGGRRSGSQKRRGVDQSKGAAEESVTPKACTRKRNKKERTPHSDFACTDLGNAERLVARYGDRLRFCPPRRRWLVWDGQRWAWDETGVVTRMAKLAVRSIYEEASRCGDENRRKALAKHAHGSENVTRIDAMVKLASTERGIPILPHQLDADPWALNVANGTLDLRSGTLRSHNPADFITKLASVRYAPDAEHPVWFRYLVTATDGDTRLAAFLRRVVGYALVGIASEKKFFFAFGKPDSAKSTFIDALAATLGDYHETAAFDTWCTQTTTGGNRGDLVRLAGARLVTSVEIAKGKRFDEALIKRVTGGDEITAAAKFESEITFRPSFTLLLAANDAPVLRDDDEGAWSRVVRIPFLHVIPKQDRDPGVRATLMDPTEAGPAILAWAVAGCLDWQRNGLGTAPVVEESTARYRDEMDRLAGFLGECCDLSGSVERKVLRDAYRNWCVENDVRYPLGAKDIASRLRALGVVAAKSNGRRIWKGIRLLGADEDPQGRQGHVGPPAAESLYESGSEGTCVETPALGDPRVPRPRRITLDADGEVVEC